MFNKINIFLFLFLFDFSTVTIAKGIVHRANSYKHAKHDVFTSSNPIFYDTITAQEFLMKINKINI